MDSFSMWTGLRDKPALDATLQSERPGVYVAGDLAGAELIKVALRQGADLGRRLAGEVAGRSVPDGAVAVVIVGAGPAGLAVAAELHDRGVPYVVVERREPLSTLDAFPKGKVLYADPPGVEVPPGFVFADAPKEAVVASWRGRVADQGLRIVVGELVGVEGSDGAFLVSTTAGEWRAAKVVLAFGLRGSPRRLDVPGSERAVDRLDDAAAHAGEDVVVVGGGDAAVEAACALDAAGARVTLLVRGARLARPKPKNQARLRASRVTVRTGARVARVTEDAVQVEGDAVPVPAKAVLALLGTEPPVDLLRRCGVRMRSDPWRELVRAPGVVLFALFTWVFYVLKQHREYWPLGEGPLGALDAALKVSVPWLPMADGSVRVLDAGFWGTALYSLAILGFGLDALRRHRSPVQRRRYASLIGFQWVFLFGVPELLAPMITSLPWKWYSLVVPWPLSLWSLAHEPAAWGWMIVGAVTSFGLIPWYVARHNEQFCSYLCGCGGLAETLGDRFRWRAPRGIWAKKLEWGGPLVLLAAIPVTLLILNDLWGLVGFRTWMAQEIEVVGDRVSIAAAPSDPSPGMIRVARAERVDDEVTLWVEKREADGRWHPNGWIGEVRVGDAVVYPELRSEGVYALPVAALSAPATVVAASSSLSSVSGFARGWYSLMVDFGLASVVGVAFYPWLGNRVWCRFFCPLRAYMEWLSRRFGRLALAANDKCISCGTCTEVCQMGIDVQGFAEQGAHLDNANSACIQCGVCVEACPTQVLSVVDKRAAGLGPGRTDVGRW